VSGQVEVLINDEIYVKEANDYTFIPKKTIHKVKNVGDEPAIILEVQTGVILSEEDIIRVKDKYKRS
jgi:mannose-6-phosphate isomerase-like protein (cupin superfamily)